MSGKCWHRDDAACETTGDDTEGGRCVSFSGCLPLACLKRATAFALITPTYDDDDDDDDDDGGQNNEECEAPDAEVASSDDHADDNRNEDGGDDEGDDEDEKKTDGHRRWQRGAT